MTITLQRLDHIPELTLRQLVFSLTLPQQQKLAESTIHTFVVRRGERVVCLFGVAREALISDYYGVWFGLTRGVKPTFSELRWINPMLDALETYYGVSLRAAVDLSKPVHASFAEFCKFIKYGEAAGFGSYERGSML